MPISRSAVLSAALTLAAAPALADLTAEDVWRDWQAVGAAMGQTLSAGAEERSGGTLTLRDVAVSSTFEGGAMRGTIDEIAMTERTDGTVEITMSPAFPFAFVMTPPDGPRVEMAMTVSQTGLVTIASGDPGDARYDYVAPLMEVTMDQVIPDADPVHMVLNMAVRNSTGSYRRTDGDLPGLESNLAAEALVGMISMSPPDGAGEVVDISFTMEDIRSESRGSLAGMAGFTTLPAMLKAGYETEGRVTYGPSSYAMTAISDDGTTQISGAAASGRFDVALRPEGVDYGGSNQGITLSVGGSMIPFPMLTFAIDETEGRFTMPLMKSDEPQDFAALLRIVNLRVDDILWSLFDPQSFLPRDPATIVIDVTGQGRWTVEITDPAVAEAMEGSDELPGELTGMSLNALRLSIAGADLTGAGDFTFDNSDLETFDGMPRPEGSVTLNLTGANGLLDKLVAMGLLPEDQAMGARMMLGIFARPAAGEDALTSTLEVDAEGRVFANGQQLR